MDTLKVKWQALSFNLQHHPVAGFLRKARISGKGINLPFGVTAVDRPNEARSLEKTNLIYGMFTTEQNYSYIHNSITRSQKFTSYHFERLDLRDSNDGGYEDYTLQGCDTVQSGGKNCTSCVDVIYSHYTHID
jgi:hypothetical protein